MASTMEIRCRACGRVTLARPEPVYEEFRKVAETFVCTACGHRYPSRNETPFLHADTRPAVFSEADKPAVVRVFRSDEHRRSCAWCRHFIVNPFYQRCGLTNREVEATDVCVRFSAKPESPAKPDAAELGDEPATRFDALFGAEAPVRKTRKTKQQT